MSHIDKVTVELRNLVTGIERANGQAAAAHRQTQEIAVRAAGAGFTAIAAGMAQTQRMVGGIQGGLGSLATAIGETTSAAGAIPRQGTPQETISGLAAVQSRIDGARDTVADVIEQVGEAQRLVVTVLQGGQPGPMLQTLDSIKQVLVLVVQQVGTIRQTIDVAIADARQLGSSGN